jgi:hypothetical protein
LFVQACLFDVRVQGVIVTTMSIHIVSQALEKGASEIQFMDSYKFVVAEARRLAVPVFPRTSLTSPAFQQLWWLVTLGCRLSQFLALETVRGDVLQPAEECLLFPSIPDVWETLLQSVDEFPALQAVLKSHGARTFGVKARYVFYKTKPAVAVTLPLARRGFTSRDFIFFGSAQANQEEVWDRLRERRASV